MKIGAYYFAGWSGKCPYDDGTPENAWAKGMPTHYTKKLATEFAGRTPIWGRRDDTPELMERQIDLAADHGLAEGFPGVALTCCGNNKPEEGYSLKTRYNVTPEGTWSTKILEKSEKHLYSEIIESNTKAWQSTPDQPLIPLVCQGWDRRPWEAPDGEGLGKGGYHSWHFEKGTLAQFRDLLNQLVKWMDANPTLVTRDRLAIIYAWNEIGEGGWLVPCKDDPDGAYLKTIRQVVLGK